MVICLNDGTQEFIENEEDLFRLIDKKLGGDVLRKIKEMFEDIRNKAEESIEYEKFDFETSELEYEDQIYELELHLKEIRNFTDDLIQDLPSKKIDEQEFLGYLRKIGRMADA